MKRRQLIRAAQIADGDSVRAQPGAILRDAGSRRIIAAGRPESIGEVVDAEVCDLAGAVVIPALVNAHTHLDLTHIGPLPWSPGEGGFVEWVDLVRSRRAVEPDEIRASVLAGAALCQAGDTRFVGDIAGVGSMNAVDALRDSNLNGVSYLEIFGQGAKQSSALELLEYVAEAMPSDERGVRLGVQPHAPYSCARAVYERAAALGLPLATHLAETLEEIAFVQNADGPLADLLRRLGVWDESIQPTGLHPIEFLADALAESARRGGAPFSAAHVNYADDAHLDMLASWPISVVYCPRASRYFGHPHESRPPHRYREMLERGINVALGTDSMLCLDTPDRISVLDEMKLLLERDGADAHALLRMATVNGARALGLDEREVTLRAGSTPELLALPIDRGETGEPLQQAILRLDGIEPLHFGKDDENARPATAR